MTLFTMAPPMFSPFRRKFGAHFWIVDKTSGLVHVFLSVEEATQAIAK